jgi:DNA invertase Pin-like site-specific DNA recombinase
MNMYRGATALQPNQFASLEEYVEAHKAYTRKKLSEAKQGVKSRTAVLTEAQVMEIRGKYLPGIVGTKQLAKEYGVGHSTISNIVTGKTWPHIPMGVYNSVEDYQAAKKAEAAAHPTSHANAKLDKEKVRAIRLRFAEGAKKLHLAKEYGVHVKTICDILDGKIWKAAEGAQA